MKQGRRAQKFILPPWWTSVIWRMPNLRQSTKNTKVELYSEATLWKMILDLMQYLPNKDHQYHKWQQQKTWISYADCQDAQDKAADAVSAYTQVKMEAAPELLKIPKSECPDIWIRLPRHKWSKSWSNLEDPVVLLERHLYSHPLAGLLWEKQFEKILLKHGWEKIPNWECLFVHREKGLFLSVYVDDLKLAGKVHSEKGLFLSVYVDDIKLAGKKHVENTQWRNWFGRTNIFPWSRIPEMYSKTMWNKQRYCWQLQNHVWTTNFRGWNWKTTMLGKYSYFFVVLWHGWSCKEMCGAILWVGKQDDSTTLQSIYSMHRCPSFQRGRIEICRRIVKRMLSNCSEMLVLGTSWTTWYSMVSEQACTINHKMDQSLWQTPESIDFIHSSHMWI